MSPDIPTSLTAPLGRLSRTAVNLLEVARFGGLETGEEPSPFDVVTRQPVYRLRRYFPDTAPLGSRPPVLLVPPLMLTAEVWDVAPDVSAVARLHAADLDPWVVDFGDPKREAGGLQRDVTDHVLAVDDAIGRVRAATRRDVHIGGYSQGGLFCYQAAALRRCVGVESIFGLGTPIETAPVGLPDELVKEVTAVYARVLSRTGVPGWAISRAFRFANPARAVRHELGFLLALHDREALLPRERRRRFLQTEGWISWPGPAIAEALEIMSEQRYLRGGLVFGDRTVTLADITCPILIFVGEKDEFGPPAAVRAIVEAAPQADVYECVMPVGHFGLGVGSQANKTTWPTLAAWVRWRAGDAPLPETLGRPDRVDDSGGGGNDGESSNAARVVYGVGLAAQTGLASVRALATTGSRAASTVRELGGEAVAQVPRLVRLERIGPRTRVSYGLLLDEQAVRHPDGVCFLFEDRGHTHAAAKHRIDSVVRGLLSVGIRRGEHVGVLMGTRPSALTVVGALSRLGAVAVLLRPEGQVAREAELAGVTRIAADPEHAQAAAGAGVPVLVLGGGGEPRDLGADVIDMERIDPDTVAMPTWYRPNPGRARDTAFILFGGTGDRTRMSRITNRRWALSAFGAASSAALSERDTVYGVAPLHHPSGLLLATAAPAAVGARLAMTRQFDPETFWEEVRRYGATVVPYTWAMLRELVDAPVQPGERGHPVRLFIGSGMPKRLWRRAQERFPPARVLEFYAATQADTILANVSGRKLGSMGRPLPGSAKVRLAAFDIEAERLVTGADGLAIRCQAEETGMLLVKIDSNEHPADDVLRDVFAAGDAWAATGDLFRRDDDGDYWLIGAATSLIRTDHGVVAPKAVEDALGELDGVDLVVCHGVPGKQPAYDVSLAAITLRAGHELVGADIDLALQGVDRDARPDIVHVVDEIPLTTWYRPDVASLNATGVPDPDGRWPAWIRTGKHAAYQPMTARRRARVARVVTSSEGSVTNSEGPTSSKSGPPAM